MAIQDSDAERRNLVLTSVAIITYYVAEGEVTQEVIKLPLINIHFHNISALIVMVWLCLFWFLYRYWLTHRQKFKSGLDNEMLQMANHRLSRWYFQHKTNLTPVPEILEKAPDKERGYILSKIETDRAMCSYALRYVYQDIKRNLNGTVSISGATLSFKSPDTGEMVERGRLPFSGFVGKIILVVLITHCFVTQESFGSYLMPYILFFVALLLGLINAIQLVL